jgi:hypothetical protein
MQAKVEKEMGAVQGISLFFLFELFDWDVDEVIGLLKIYGIFFIGCWMKINFVVLVDFCSLY